MAAVCLADCCLWLCLAGREVVPPLPPLMELTLPVLKVCLGNLELSSAWELPISWSWRNTTVEVKRRRDNYRYCHLAVIAVLVIVIIVIIVFPPVHIIAFRLRVSLRSGREERGEGKDNQELEHGCWLADGC